MIDNLIERLKVNEGFSSTVYDDHLGFPTIGYGFAIKDLILSEEISTVILTDLVEKKLKALQRQLDWFSDIPPEVQGVILEMTYQLGYSGFCKFKKTINYFKEKEFKNASEEMLDSKWAKQTPDRAKKLSQIVWNHG